MTTAMKCSPALLATLRPEAEVIRDKGGHILGYVTLWKDKAGKLVDPSSHDTREEALEHAADEYDSVRYAGTLTIFATGSVALCEDWSEEAAALVKQKQQDWLDEQGLRRDYYAKVL